MGHSQGLQTAKLWEIILTFLSIVTSNCYVNKLNDFF